MPEYEVKGQARPGGAWKPGEAEPATHHEAPGSMCPRRQRNIEPPSEASEMMRSAQITRCTRGELQVVVSLCEPEPSCVNQVFESDRPSDIWPERLAIVLA